MQSIGGLRPDGGFEGHGGHRRQGNHRADGQRPAGSIRLGPEAFDALQRGTCPKGDVLATAKVAAIQAVKSTSTIIPMCHPILVEGDRRGFLAG